MQAGPQRGVANAPIPELKRIAGHPASHTASDVSDENVFCNSDNTSLTETGFLKNIFGDKYQFY